MQHSPAGCERLQRQAASHDLAAAVQARRRDEAAVRTAAAHLTPLARAVAAQRDSLAGLTRTAAVQLGRLGHALDEQVRPAGQTIAVRQHPPRPVAPEVVRKSSPSPGC